MSNYQYNILGTMLIKTVASNVLDEIMIWNWSCDLEGNPVYDIKRGTFAPDLDERRAELQWERSQREKVDMANLLASLVKVK